MTIVGLARSGIGAANLLSELGANVTVTDVKREPELKDFIQRLNPSVRLAVGEHPPEIFLSSDMLVVSPGVPLSIRPISDAKKKGIPVIGELELAYQIATYGSDNPSIAPAIPSNLPLERGGMGDLKEGRKGGFLAVTGTNGKSTTTALLDFMMKKGGFGTVLGGNIGNALTEEIRKALSVKGKEIRGRTSHALRLAPIDYIVAEVSSFQLESIKDFRPKGATILNVMPDHLDRYRSLEEYSDAKARIFENQGGGDFLVLNRDDPETMKIANEKLEMKGEKPKTVYFSRMEEVEGLYSRGGMVYCNLPDLSGVSSTSPFMNAEEIRIKGVHNLENAMAASAMALLAGCPVAAVIDSLREFSGLEHRLEFVRELKGVVYFNDSKGTNVSAVMKSLESFQQPVILIAGGRDKAGDFSLLRHLVRKKVKAIVLIGEAGEKIQRALGDLTYTAMAKDLRDAVDMSRAKAAKGDVVLLSPACASFDMFLNFEDRGRQFKEIVMEMDNG